MIIRAAIFWVHCDFVINFAGMARRLFTQTARHFDAVIASNTKAVVDVAVQRACGETYTRAPARLAAVSGVRLGMA